MLTKASMKRRPTPPGEMLLEEFLRPAGITQVALAAKMGVPNGLAITVLGDLVEKLGDGKPHTLQMTRGEAVVTAL